MNNAFSYINCKFLHLFSDKCYINGTNGNQLVYNHSEIIETGRCNVSKCIDGVIEEEYKHPYMIYCDTDSSKKCQVTKL